MLSRPQAASASWQCQQCVPRINFKGHPYEGPGLGICLVTSVWAQISKLLGACQYACQVSDYHDGTCHDMTLQSKLLLFDMILLRHTTDCVMSHQCRCRQLETCSVYFPWVRSCFLKHTQIFWKHECCQDIESE